MNSEESLESVCEQNLEFLIGFGFDVPESNDRYRRGFDIVLKRPDRLNLVCYKSKAERLNDNLWIISEAQTANGVYLNWKGFQKDNPKDIDGILKERVYSVCKAFIRRYSPRMDSQILEIQKMIDDGL